MGLFSGMNTKAIIAALGAAATALYTAMSDGVLEGFEVGAVAGAFLAALGLVWVVPFERYAKVITATVVTLAGALVTSLEDGVISGNEWYALVAIVATAVATFQSPNAPATLRAGLGGGGGGGSKTVM